MAHKKPIKETLYGIFLEQIAKHGDSDECLIWQYGRDKHGYGHLYMPWEGMKNNRRTVKAHTLAFFVAYGHWPTPKCLHDCDTPPCFNPKHLHEGNQSKNIQDMYDRGRGVDNRGERCGSAKLTEQQVLEIRAIVGMSQYEIARLYKVSRTVIEYIRTNRTWKHLL